MSTGFSNLLSNIDLNNDKELLGKFVCYAVNPYPGESLIVKVTAKQVLVVDKIAQKRWISRDVLTVDKVTYENAEQNHGWVYGVFDQPPCNQEEWANKIDWIIYTIKERHNITLDRNKVKIQSTKFFDSRSQAANTVIKAIDALNRVKHTSLQFLTIEESIPNVEYTATIKDCNSGEKVDFTLNRGFFSGDGYHNELNTANSSLNDLNKVMLRIAYDIYQYFKRLDYYNSLKRP